MKNYFIRILIGAVISVVVMILLGEIVGEIGGDRISATQGFAAAAWAAAFVNYGRISRLEDKDR